MKSAASGSTNRDPAAPMTGSSDLDLAIETIDQRAALWIELGPIQRADLRKIVLALGERLCNGALELDLGVGRNHVVRRFQHLLLDRRGKMQVDVLRREFRLRGTRDHMQAGLPADRTGGRYRELDRNVLGLQGLHEVEIVGRDVDLLLLPQRCESAERSEERRVGKECRS